MTCPHLVDSGVYVLGALAPAQRHAFEAHMATCAECRAEVNDLAVLPGLLGRLDEPSVVTEAELPPPTVLPRVLETVHRKRRTRRFTAVAAGLVIACLALVAGLTMPSPGGRDRTPAPIAMHQMRMVDSTEPVTAQVGFATVDGGTRIELHCQYPKLTGHSYGGTEGFALYVYPRSGAPAQQVGTWSAKPGQSVTVPAITSWPVTDMAKVELRSDEGTPLLVYDVG